MISRFVTLALLATYVLASSEHWNDGKLANILLLLQIIMPLLPSQKIYAAYSQQILSVQVSDEVIRQIPGLSEFLTSYQT